MVFCPDIGYDVLATTNSVYWASRIYFLGQSIDIGNEAWIFAFIWPEFFVERSPSNDRRMVKVAFNNVLPFGDEVTGSFYGVSVKSPAWCFTPCDITKFVCPVVEAFFKNFLVKACSIKTGSFRQKDVVLQSVIGWSCPDSVRIKSLVEYQALVIRLIVQINHIALSVNLAHTEVRLHFIDNVSVGVL